MATHSNILAWRIPMDRGAWQATVHGVAKSWTCLKRLSTHARKCRRHRLDPSVRPHQAREGGQEAGWLLQGLGQVRG